MTRRDKNRTARRAFEKLTPAEIAEARAAWSRVWNHRRPGCTVAEVDRARLQMLTAIDQGQTLLEAEAAGRAAIAGELIEEAA